MQCLKQCKNLCTLLSLIIQGLLASCSQTVEEPHVLMHRQKTGDGKRWSDGNHGNRYLKDLFISPGDGPDMLIETTSVSAHAISNHESFVLTLVRWKKGPLQKSRSDLIQTRSLSWKVKMAGKAVMPAVCSWAEQERGESRGGGDHHIVCLSSRLISFSSLNKQLASSQLRRICPVFARSVSEQSCFQLINIWFTRYSE